MFIIFTGASHKSPFHSKGVGRFITNAPRRSPRCHTGELAAPDLAASPRHVPGGLAASYLASAQSLPGGSAASPRHVPGGLAASNLVSAQSLPSGSTASPNRASPRRPTGGPSLLITPPAIGVVHHELPG